TEPVEGWSKTVTDSLSKTVDLVNRNNCFKNKLFQESFLSRKIHPATNTTTIYLSLTVNPQSPLKGGVRTVTDSLSRTSRPCEQKQLLQRNKIASRIFPIVRFILPQTQLRFTFL
ncbi:24558_t:CDS:2, partial [Gigaspora rosea]